MSDAASTTHARHTELSGIGGWLVLVAVGQVIGPIRMVISLITYHSSLPEGAWQLVPVALAVELLMTLAVLAIVLWTSVLFFQHDRRFPAMFTLEWAAATLLYPVNIIWASLSTGAPMPSLASGSDVLEWVILAAIGLAWVMYVRTSVRVRNTFVN